MKLLKKINTKLILFELLSTIFFVLSFRIFILTSQQEKLKVFFTSWDKWFSTYSETPGEFLLEMALWTFYSLLFFSIIIFFLNRKFKIHLINTLLVIIPIITLFPTGIFTKSKITKYPFNLIKIFEQGFLINHLIVGIVLLLLSVIFFWLTIKRLKEFRIDKID